MESSTAQFYFASRQSMRELELSRNAYLLEQYRHSVPHTEIPNPTASAKPARALDTTLQFAERMSNVSSVLVITTHATMFALPARQLESPAHTPLSNAPIAKVHTKPTPPPAKPSLTSTKHPKTTKPPPTQRPPPLSKS